MYVCVCLCENVRNTFVQGPAEARGHQMSLALELQVVVSHLRGDAANHSGKHSLLLSFLSNCCMS